MNTEGRIDVHHHVLPEFYKEVQRSAGITGSAYRGFPEWSPESSLALMDKLGIGYEHIRARRADIVYCSVSGYGQDGRAARRRAYAPVVHAEVGLLRPRMARLPVDCLRRVQRTA